MNGLNSLLLFVLPLFLAACGPRLDNKPGKQPDKPNNASTNSDPHSNSSHNGSTGSNNETSPTEADCGNGVLEPGELCDPGIASGAGACPTSCSASSCSTVAMVGAAATCDARCVETPVACGASDGCCPAGCDGGTDSDCSNVCGDGVIEAPETCDGNCPTTCNDGDACTTDRMLGSPDTCNSRCEFDPITTCVNNDGCCPSGCTSSNDNDCACVPKTCSQAGAQCGSVSNGCGGTINCGSCGSNETCESNQCVPTQTPGDGIGSACSTSAQCGTSDATICIEWPGGYCSSRCNDAACASGSECKWIGITDQGCLKTCVRDTDCRTGYMCDERGSGAKVCTPNGPRTGEFGAPCNAAAECDSGVCHPTFYVCTQACSVGACPVGYGCDLVNQVCSLACAVDTDCPGVSACLFGTCFGTG